MVHTEGAVWSGHNGISPQAQLWPNSVQPLIYSHVTQNIRSNTEGALQHTAGAEW